ncbi:MAG TPA: hypothetical protein VM370_10965 [Candidatus Thermoplasmatota archaeon]|nr:hypothetical protein [Candidatus Thermoplasmatota archaeon]
MGELFEGKPSVWERPRADAAIGLGALAVMILIAFGGPYVGLPDWAYALAFVPWLFLVVFLAFQMRSASRRAKAWRALVDEPGMRKVRGGTRYAMVRFPAFERECSGRAVRVRREAHAGGAVLLATRWSPPADTPPPDDRILGRIEPILEMAADDEQIAIAVPIEGLTRAALLEKMDALAALAAAAERGAP